MEVRRIREAVASSITDRGPEVLETVVSKLASLELRRRSDMIFEGLNIIEKLQKDLEGINKFDKVFIDESTDPPSKKEWKTLERVKAISNAKEKVTKVDNAISSALTNANEEAYTNLRKVLDKYGKSGDQKKGQ